ncbi:MAG: TrkA family potassium uptake protein, partial [Acidobacteriota bacterium]|nr:TrkA family potassium uptake protein [Acidobacteriota bacterium]
EDNLVVSWLSKQEFGVPRVISRINNSRNEWLFNETWGVDVSVSTPALITSLVDEAVEVGSIVKLMDLANGRMKLIEVTLAGDSPAVARKLTLDELRLSDSVVVVAVVRSDQPMVPNDSMRFQEHDHVILMVRPEGAQECATAFIG